MGIIDIQDIVLRYTELSYGEDDWMKAVAFVFYIASRAMGIWKGHVECIEL